MAEVTSVRLREEKVHEDTGIRHSLKRLNLVPGNALKPLLGMRNNLLPSRCHGYKHRCRNSHLPPPPNGPVF